MPREDVGGAAVVHVEGRITPSVSTQCLRTEALAEPARLPNARRHQLRGTIRHVLETAQEGKGGRRAAAARMGALLQFLAKIQRQGARSKILR